jgi:hypothetical protein
MSSTIGKVLVLVHGALSLTVVAWALGVYTNRIDWNTPPAAAGKETGPGLYDRQKNLAADYNASADRALARWSTNLNQVQALEAERYPRRAFYANHLNMIQTGKRLDGTAVTNPVQQMPLDPKGYISVPMVQGQLDVNAATSRPPVEVRPGIAGKSVAKYDDEMRKFVADIQDSQKKSQEAIVERDKLNREIVGVTQPALVKGLRTLINEQKQIIDEAVAEDRYVSVFVTNRESDFGLFKKRRDAMLARVEELKAAK